jgi:hypothetical protein
MFFNVMLLALMMLAPRAGNVVRHRRNRGGNR